MHGWFQAAIGSRAPPLPPAPRPSPLPPTAAHHPLPPIISPTQPPSRPIPPPAPNSIVGVQVPAVVIYLLGSIRLDPEFWWRTRLRRVYVCVWVYFFYLLRVHVCVYVFSCVCDAYVVCICLCLYDICVYVCVSRVIGSSCARFCVNIYICVLAFGL